MTNKPDWITFTGVDAYTDLDRLMEISGRFYPHVEWGVLFSKKKTEYGHLRYPPVTTRNALKQLWHAKFAAHLCGTYAEEVNSTGISHLDLDMFRRVQVNHRKPDIEMLENFAYKRVIKSVIAQSRDSEGFPVDAHNLAWLFDQSGGRGDLPTKYPKGPDDQTVGYAGGINPDNILDVINKIDADSYWIDMETGVRNEHDLLDLGKCEAILEAVYVTNNS